MDPSVLSKAKPGEPLSLYIAAGPKAVSSALVREEGGTQIPVYYVIQVLKDADTQYPNLEKFAMALVYSGRKLRQYFQGREIRVVTDQQLRKVIHKPDASGSDSQIVVKQTSGEYIAKDPTLAQYQAMVRNILEATPDITILQINREENSKADELSKLVQNASDLVSSVYFEELKVPSIEQAEVLCIGSPDNWMTSYIAYLRDGTLPEDQNKARYLKHKAARFFLEEGQLYRRTFSAPTLKCVDPEEANYCLREVHEGICGDHLAAKALAYKIIRQGYYWPTIHSDSVTYVRKCPQCQKFSNVPRQNPTLPASVLSPIPSLYGA
ncbi:uncharacterized protein LOC141711256 [Apium graveolens]|uniref:uncharacterized protein LOC141711256 n=1 Tax=Apium graveolens TaxID=4045 RepID=UPI003D78CB23